MCPGSRIHGEERAKSFSDDLQRDYLQLLTYEKERSQRHNHFFTLCGLEFSNLSADQLFGVLWILKEDLRHSDYVFSIPVYGWEQQNHAKALVLLPETDSEKGAVVRARLVELCRVSKHQAQVGLATYPDDATMTTELLSRAFKPCH